MGRRIIDRDARVLGDADDDERDEGKPQRNPETHLG
jgi:hypothetical protein